MESLSRTISFTGRRCPRVCVCWLLLLTCGGTPAFADGTGDREATDSVRAIEMQLNDLKPDSASHSEIVICGLGTTSTDDTKAGYGAAVLFDYARFEPVVLRAGLQVVRSQINTDKLHQADFLAFAFDLSCLISPGRHRFRPYAGLGVTIYTNLWPTDRGPTGWIGPYDEYTPSEYDYGSSLAAHLRAGNKLRVSRKVSVCFDLKCTYSRPTADITLRYDQIDQELHQAVKYDQRIFTLLLGFSIRIR